MNTFSVTFGGRSFDVRPLNIKQAKAWRAKFAAPFEQITQALAGAGKIQLDDGQQIAGLIQSISGTLIQSTDIVADMFFAYADLPAARDWIEENGTDQEMIAAFVEVLKAAYPFTSLLAIVQPGQAKVTTSKN